MVSPRPPTAWHYTLARQSALLDHLSQGRAVWSIVTSWTPQARLNYGHDQDASHGKHCAMSEDFLQAVDALGRSYLAEAELDDRAWGQYLGSARLTLLNYKRPYWQTKDPLNIPGSRRGAPSMYGPVNRMMAGSLPPAGLR